MAPRGFCFGAAEGSRLPPGGLGSSKATRLAVTEPRPSPGGAGQAVTSSPPPGCPARLLARTANWGGGSRRWSEKGTELRAGAGLHRAECALPAVLRLLLPARSSAGLLWLRCCRRRDAGIPGRASKAQYGLMKLPGAGRGSAGQPWAAACGWLFWVLREWARPPSSASSCLVTILSATDPRTVPASTGPRCYSTARSTT